MGSALPAGQVKVTRPALRICAMKQSLKWEKVYSPREGGNSQEAEWAHPGLSSGTPAGMEPAFALGSCK